MKHVMSVAETRGHEFHVVGSSCLALMLISSENEEIRQVSVSPGVRSTNARFARLLVFPKIYLLNNR